MNPNEANRPPRPPRPGQQPVPGAPQPPSQTARPPVQGAPPPTPGPAMQTPPMRPPGQPVAVPQQPPAQRPHAMAQTPPPQPGQPPAMRPPMQPPQQTPPPQPGAPQMQRPPMQPPAMQPPPQQPPVQQAPQPPSQPPAAPAEARLAPQQPPQPPVQQQPAHHDRVVTETGSAKHRPIVSLSQEALKSANERVNDLLKMLVERDGSDLHLKANACAFMRIDGHLTPINPSEILTPEIVEYMGLSVMNQRQRDEYFETNECDLSYSLPGVSRFRVNVFRQSGFTGSVMRTIPLKIHTVQELNLPPVLEKLAERPKGLILVTGPTGSGKSTTLAAMIDHINRRKSEHILTIEDPIEFLHSDKKCTVCQREVGQDTLSFANALRSALREDPDVILVGELRNLETISMAITAAETGHLVFATLHTTGAVQTINRVIDVFPPHQQQQIRMQLSVTLQSVISQTLLPTAKGRGRVVALEIMVINPAISSLIRENKVHMISQTIQAGREQGMQSLDQHLAELYKKRLITMEAALSKCQIQTEFKNLCERL